MNIIDRFYNWRAQRQVKKYFTGVRQSVNNRIDSGRQTRDRWVKQFAWYDGLIRRDHLRSKNIMDSLRLIRDINPDASLAIWNFLRLSNQGHELECLKPTGTNDKQGLDYLNSLASRVGKLYAGGTDQLINVLNLTGYTQGAIALEVELNEGLNDVVDFHAVDPSSLDFKKDKDTGEIELVQKQPDGTYKVLNQEQVFYFPIDPDIGDPYGRSPILPVLQIVFFQVEVLKDLKAVAHHQGHARFDISIMEEAILKNIPPSIAAQGETAVREFVMNYIKDIEAAFKGLKPDDNFIHPDSVKVEMAGGTNGKSMDVTKIIDVINQQVVSALKQLPILLGRNEGSTETHGTIQWQIYVAGIESIQRGTKRILEKAYNLALQIQGKQSRARVTFNKIRTTDRQAEATAEKTETETKIMQINQGWIDNNEAANDMVGHDAVGEPINNSVPATPPVGRSRRMQVKRAPKTRTDDEEDEYVKELDTPYASDLAVLTTRARDAFFSLLKDQRDQYIENVKVAPELPSRMLVSINSVRSITRDEKPEPDAEFEEWVKVNILKGQEEQMALWNDEGLDWIEQAAQIAGEATLVELESSIDFNTKDETLMRWLTNRANDSAELIQGTTDRDVIMALWDVVYDGKYSIDKCVEALQDSFTFSEGRATRIARTEVLNAGRAGQYHGDMQSGMVIGKEWKSAKQDRTRAGHRAADGQIVKFDGAFSVENGSGVKEELLFPGDHSLGATASNTVQCRCWYKRILQGEEDKLKG
ncbi:hypothetical protein J1P26_21850 [Neobacillus sp. MM2021_6]|uniref:phage minor head protein n=1 Tax=Bacillaceae TaxID=186817 RepID=UPI00140CC8BF|nr:MULTISPECIES: phage minor head protein [Bacillaceae]MBO0962351.1 hypothetical protein [Neobacillus sp. MM2021_6]NHC20834.1 hypothetical protein [Bacillus sp. MM2020_4]